MRLQSLVRVQSLAPFQKDPDQRSLNGLRRPYVPLRIGRAVFITSAIKKSFSSAGSMVFTEEVW